jgi:hypothetical protein
MAVRRGIVRLGLLVIGVLLLVRLLLVRLLLLLVRLSVLANGGLRLIKGAWLRLCVLARRLLRLSVVRIVILTVSHGNKE